MKKTILAVLAMGALSCAFFSQQLQAAAISGDVAMGGQIQFNSSLGTATTVTHWISVGANNDGFSTVLGVTGDLATFISPLDEAAMAQPWNFSSGGPQAALWSVGGFTFDLASSTTVTQIFNFLNVTGVGTISGNGFDSTPATFTLTVTQLGTRLVFGAITATTPDGGTTVMLLGTALGALGMARRFLKK